MNLFVENPNFGKLTSMHFYAWKRGLKTGMYYLRTKAAAAANEAAAEVKAENGAPAEDGKAADSAHAEAMTAATDVVGDLPAAEAGANEEKAEAPAEVPVENDAPVVTV